MFSRSFDLLYNILSPHADRHAGDISFTVCLTLFVRKYFCNGYLRRRLTQGDEIWQDDKSGWVAGHLPFWWILGQGLAPMAKKWKLLSAPVDTSWHPGVYAAWSNRHVGIYASRDNWHTSINYLHSPSFWHALLTLHSCVCTTHL